MSDKKDSHAAFGGGKASVTPSKKKLKDMPYFTQTASGIGLVSGALLPSDPSITKLDVLKRFPAASAAQESFEPLPALPGSLNKLGTFDSGRPSMPDFDLAPL